VLFVLVPVFALALALVTMLFVLHRTLGSYKSRRLKRHRTDEATESDDGDRLRRRV
jgi:hypothetical protein